MLNEAIAKDVSKILEGSSIESTVLLTYVCAGIVTAVIIGILNKFLADVHSLKVRQRVLASLSVALCVGLATHFFLIAGVRTMLLNEANRVLMLARGNQLAAVPLRGWDGNNIEGYVVLRESRTEMLFNKQVETGSWSKRIDIEKARELSNYLATMNQGVIAWKE